MGRLSWVVLLFLIAFALRIFQLDAVDLRGDEAFSVVHWTATPFTDAWFDLAENEPHPVGAYTLYWAWNGLVGESVLATRLLSVFGNLLGMAITMALAQRILWDWRLSLLVGMLWAVNPFMIWHAQDARTYGVLTALIPLNFYTLLKALEKDSWRGWLPYILTGIVALYIYYFQVFWFAAQAIYLLGVRRGWLNAVKSWAVIAIACIPVFLQVYVLLFVSEYEGNASGADFAALFSDFAPALLLGETVAVSVVFGAFVTVAVLVGVWQARRPTSAMVISWLIVPALLLYGVSLFSDFFRPRYLSPVTPAVLIALVLLIALVTGERRRLAVILAGVIAVMSLQQVGDYYFNDPPKAPDWSGLTDYLADRTEDDDIVVFGSPDPSIEYYYEGRGNFYIVPIGPTDWPADFETLVSDYDAIYIAMDARTGDARQYIEARQQFIPGDSYPAVVQYRPWEVSASEIEHPLAVQFGELAILRGYTLLEGRSGGSNLLLYWEALQQSEQNHSVLLHLVAAGAGTDAPAIRSLDHGIATSIVSTTAWQPGTLYRDPVPLADVPAGHYTILVGMYPSEMPDARLPSEGGERYPLTDVVVP